MRPVTFGHEELGSTVRKPPSSLWSSFSMQTSQYVKASKWMALATVALGYFAVQLAMTSVPPILPTLAQLFASDVSLVSWTMTAYFLSVTSSM